MKKYKVWVEFEREIIADSQEEAEQIFKKRYLKSRRDYTSVINSKRISKN